MVLTIASEQFQRMKMAVMDEDGKAALDLLKEFIKRIEQQQNAGMKTHLRS